MWTCPTVLVDGVSKFGQYIDLAQLGNSVVDLLIHIAYPVLVVHMSDRGDDALSLGSVQGVGELDSSFGFIKSCLVHV